jgi:hypothetical protein
MVAECQQYSTAGCGFAARHVAQQFGQIDSGRVDALLPTVSDLP